MDTKDTAETTAPLVAPAELAPKPNPAGETEPEDPQHHRELPSSRNASDITWTSFSISFHKTQSKSVESRKQQGMRKSSTSTNTSNTSSLKAVQTIL